MVYSTTNRNYPVPESDEKGWDTPIQDTFDNVDADVAELFNNPVPGPLSSSLDAGGYDINNVANVNATSLFSDDLTTGAIDADSVGATTATFDDLNAVAPNSEQFNGHNYNEISYGRRTFRVRYTAGDVRYIKLATYEGNSSIKSSFTIRNATGISGPNEWGWMCTIQYRDGNCEPQWYGWGGSDSPRAWPYITREAVTDGNDKYHIYIKVDSYTDFVGTMEGNEQYFPILNFLGEYIDGDGSGAHTYLESELVGGTVVLDGHADGTNLPIDTGSLDTGSATMEDGRVTGNVSVSVPSDFSTLSAALDFLGDHLPSTTGDVTVNIESGHTIGSNIVLSDGDWSHITVTSTDATVPVGAIGAGVDFMEVNNGHGPMIDTVFDGQGNGRRGVRLNQSSIIFASGAGYKNAAWSNLSVSGGIAWAKDGVFTGADQANNGEYAVEAMNGMISASRADVSNSGQGVSSRQSGVISFRNGVANGVGDRALSSAAGYLDAWSAEAKNCGGDAVWANMAATINARGTYLDGAGNFSARSSRSSLVVLDRGRIGTPTNATFATAFGGRISAMYIATGDPSDIVSYSNDLGTYVDAEPGVWTTGGVVFSDAIPDPNDVGRFTFSAEVAEIPVPEYTGTVSLEFFEMKTGTHGDQIHLQVRDAGTATWLDAGDYDYVLRQHDSGGIDQSLSAEAANQIVVNANGASYTRHRRPNFELNMTGNGNSSLETKFDWRGSSAGPISTIQGSGAVTQQINIDRIRISSAGLAMDEVTGRISMSEGGAF